ncbi:MAG: phage Gp37/Gp68 family protein [Chloroflexi bacterium]|nr:phage Gp37/Gp68 family protein [Chloroflexota bacterium]
MTTKIEWCDETWNPIRARMAPGQKYGEGAGWACVRVSPGCLNCYAATLNKRLGTGLDYTVPAMGQVKMYLDEKTLLAPLRWRKPRRVFVCSMTDVFGEWVPDEWLDRIFAVMALAPQHTFQVLTKRSARMREYHAPGQLRDVHVVDAAYEMGYMLPPAHLLTWPLPNVWLGVSAEDQERADERIPHLLSTPAAVRWVSAEPLLGPVELTRLRHPSGDNLNALWGCTWVDGSIPDQTGPSERLDWIVTGGESGPGARPMDLAWARSLRDQCAAAGVAFFMKQTGENAHDTTPGTTFSLTAYRKRKSRHGEDPAEWPADLRVREWPGVKS